MRAEELTPSGPGGAAPIRRRPGFSVFRATLAELGAVCVAVLLLAVNIAQAYSNNRAANAAQAAAQAAEDTLISSSRPWAGFTDITIDRLDFQPRIGAGASALLASGSFKIENFGNSPATRVSASGFGVFFTADDNPPPAWAAMECPAAETASRDGALTSVVMPKDTILRAIAFRGTLPPGLAIPYHAWLIGCVAYQDSIHGGMHHTRILMYSSLTPTAPASFVTMDSSAD